MLNDCIIITTSIVDGEWGNLYTEIARLIPGSGITRPGKGEFFC